MCSKPCGSGKQSRTRYCNSPKPSNGGRHCFGLNRQERPCNRNSCIPQFEGSKIWNLSLYSTVLINVWQILHWNLILILIADCSCDPKITLRYKDGKEVGACNTIYKNKGGNGPICYVNQPSSCKDLVANRNDPSKQYSWEACTNYHPWDHQYVGWSHKHLVTSQPILDKSFFLVHQNIIYPSEKL